MPLRVRALSLSFLSPSLLAYMAKAKDAWPISVRANMCAREGESYEEWRGLLLLGIWRKEGKIYGRMDMGKLGGSVCPFHYMLMYLCTKKVLF